MESTSISLTLIALAALGGGLAGLVSGFLTAVVALQWKRARNNALIRRGEPPFKDEILLPFHKPGAAFGALTAAIAASFLGLSAAVILGAAAFPAFYTVVAVGAFIAYR